MVTLDELFRLYIGGWFFREVTKIGEGRWICRGGMPLRAKMFYMNDANTELHNVDLTDEMAEQLVTEIT